MMSLTGDGAAAGRFPSALSGRSLCPRGRWLNGGMPLATQVSGKRIGLLGMGNIGSDRPPGAGF